MKTQAEPTAQDFMHRDVHTVPSDMPLVDIVEFLLKHELSNVPVVQMDGDKPLLRGFVSEADCLEALASEMFYGMPIPPQTAETVMKKHPTCVSPETDIFALTSIFTSHRYRHVPVVKGQVLLGIVSRRDVLKALDEFYREWIRDRNREKFRVDLHKIVNHRFLVTQ